MQASEERLRVPVRRERILGDPGAVSGGEGKVVTGEKIFRRRKVKYEGAVSGGEGKVVTGEKIFRRRKVKYETFRTLLFFAEIFFRPLRLSPRPH